MSGARTTSDSSHTSRSTKLKHAANVIDDAALGKWVSKQRVAQTKGKMSAGRSEQLRALGFSLRLLS